MSKAIVTFGVGHYRDLLEIALPSYKAFADRHGYDLIVAEQVGRQRPAPWYKVRCLLELLSSYDLVGFWGCDMIVIDGRDDLPLPDNADGHWLQAMVAHNTGDGHVPNTDMWFCWKGMVPWLERVWDNTEHLMHGWWEQASLMTLMGYDVAKRPVAPGDAANELYVHTYWLPNEWNVHIWDNPKPSRARIQHATMWPNRPEIMRQWAAQAEGWING